MFIGLYEVRTLCLCSFTVSGCVGGMWCRVQCVSESKCNEIALCVDFEKLSDGRGENLSCLGGVQGSCVCREEAVG